MIERAHSRANAPAPKRSENLRASELMDRSGLTGQQIAAALSGHTKRHFDATMVSKMRKDRRVQDDEMELLESLAARPADKGAAYEQAIQLTDTAITVPLFGSGGGVGGVLRLSEEHFVRPVPIHPAQIGSRGAFAVYVLGDSMEPKLADGDIAFVMRNMPPVKNQVCIVEMNCGEAFVRIYDGADDSTIFVRQLNPAKRTPFARRDVANVYRVVGTQFGSY